MGELLEFRGWCRQRWCRGDSAAEHHDADGCSCHPQAAEPAEPEELSSGDRAEPQRDLFGAWEEDGERSPERSDAGSAPRLTLLTAKAARLAAFACRACGRNTRRMIEAPEMFFRCEECARENRWPPSRRRA